MESLQSHRLPRRNCGGWPSNWNGRQTRNPKVRILNAIQKMIAHSIVCSWCHSLTSQSRVAGTFITQRIPPTKNAFTTHLSMHFPSTFLRHQRAICARLVPILVVFRTSTCVLSKTQWRKHGPANWLWTSRKRTGLQPTLVSVP